MLISSILRKIFLVSIEPISISGTPYRLGIGKRPSTRQNLPRQNLPSLGFPRQSSFQKKTANSINSMNLFASIAVHSCLRIPHQRHWLQEFRFLAFDLPLLTRRAVDNSCRAGPDLCPPRGLFSPAKRQSVIAGSLSRPCGIFFLPSGFHAGHQRHN